MRHYTSEDAEALGPVFGDPYAAMFYPAMNTTEALDRWIGWNLKNYDDYGFGLWVLELLETGQFIGDAGITYQTVEGARILEIGWHVHPAFRSMGYATEAAQACLAFGFSSLQASTLSSIVDPKNIASIKVATRVHSSQREYQGKQGVMLLFTTTASQFAARPNPSTERTSSGKPAAASHVPYKY